MKSLLEVKSLYARIGDTQVLSGVNLTVPIGELHVIMGANGAGKSSLANVLMGHPSYEVTKGSIVIGGKKIEKAAPEERATHGLFLAFQYPREIHGVQLDEFLYSAHQSMAKARGEVPLSVFEFNEIIERAAKELDFPAALLHRSVNEGFSGGEKKKAELLQLFTLNPRVAILDEPDSGLDVDALNVLCEGLKKFQNPERSVILITHYTSILDRVTPDVVHVMSDGTIVKSGGKELIERVVTSGFESFK